MNAKLVAARRRAVYDRSGGRCERCGTGLGFLWECHHRKLRAQGGDWSAVNLLALHPACHNPGPDSVHGAPTVAYRDGYLVRGGSDPADMPVYLFGRRWARLAPGGYVVEAVS